MTLRERTQPTLIKLSQIADAASRRYVEGDTSAMKEYDRTVRLIIELKETILLEEAASREASL